jgi:photosystem II stability/assembly factor-like uncharacterized protein
MPTPTFLAVGQQGTRLTSPDGVTWSAEQTGKEGEIYRGCAIGNAHLVAAGTFGGKNILASSPDAKSWKTTEKDGQYKLFVRAVGYGTPDNQPTFVAVGGEPVTVGASNPFSLLSTDGGVTWSDYVMNAGKTILRRLAWGNDRFVAVGDRGRRSMSKDGRDWKDVRKVKAIDTLIDVAYGKNLFVGVGLHGLRMFSEDGLTWSERIPGEEGEHLNSICFTGDRFVAVAPGATYTSDDGRKWSRTPNSNAPTIAPHGKINGQDTFIGATWKAKFLHSKDALTWTQTHKGENHLEALAFGLI